MTQHVPPETVALVRRRYADGDSVAAIKAATGIARGALYRCLDGRYADGSGAPLPLPPLPRRRNSKSAEVDDAPSRRQALVERVWRNAEAQVDQIETRLAGSGLAADDPERGTRTLAILVRTLRDLAAFDAAESERRAADPSSKAAEYDKPVPRNIDDLRRELAEKLAKLVQQDSEGGGGADLRPGFEMDRT
jgi:hypothetical protein